MVSVQLTLLPRSHACRAGIVVFDAAITLLARPHPAKWQALPTRFVVWVSQTTLRCKAMSGYLLLVVAASDAFQVMQALGHDGLLVVPEGD